MKAAISQVKAGHKFCAPLIYKPKISFSCSMVSLRDRNGKKILKDRVLRSGVGFEIKCAKEGSVDRMLMEKNEMDMEDELIGMRKLSGKCQEIGGLVELLECLEREAIMGEDEGREPNDYNRRAKIFDKSSRVFQALKETNAAHQE